MDVITTEEIRKIVKEVLEEEAIVFYDPCSGHRFVTSKEKLEETVKKLIRQNVSSCGVHKQLGCDYYTDAFEETQAESVGWNIKI